MKIKLTAILFLLAGFAHAQNVDEVLAKYFANTGGLDKWKSLKSMKMEGKAPTQMGDLPVTVYSKAPNKMKTVLNVQGQEFVPQAFDGQTAWTLNPFAGGKDPQALDEEQAKELRDEQFESEFIDYKKKGHEVTLEGKEDIDGVSCFKVKLVKNKNNQKEDVTEYHYFDTENYVPIMQKRFVRSGPGKGTEVQSYFSDYQETGGLMMPYFIETKVNGQTLSKITVEKISVNENIDDSVFAFKK